MAALRWLVISHDASNSGAPRMLLEVLRGVRSALGPTWCCDILMDRGGPLLPEFSRIGSVRQLSHRAAERGDIVARCFRRFVDRPLLKPRRFARWVSEWHAAGRGVVYSNTGTNGRLLRALPATGDRVISHVHELAYSLHRFSSPADLAATLARTDRFLAVSSAVVADLVALGVPPARVRRVPNFLSVLPERPQHEAARARVCQALGLAPESRLVVGCGHIDPVKGTDLYVAAARRVVERAPRPVAFVWVGGDDDRPFARRVRMDAERGGSPVVRFTGYVDSPVVYLAASDMVLVTSRTESFSLVALEAGALGRPVLAFAAARGPSDLLEKEALVPELTAEAMAGAALELLERPELAKRRGEELRTRISREFLAERWIHEIIAVTENRS